MTVSHLPRARTKVSSSLIRISRTSTLHPRSSLTVILPRRQARSFSWWNRHIDPLSRLTSRIEKSVRRDETKLREALEQRREPRGPRGWGWYACGPGGRTSQWWIKPGTYVPGTKGEDGDKDFPFELSKREKLWRQRAYDLNKKCEEWEKRLETKGLGAFGLGSWISQMASFNEGKRKAVEVDKKIDQDSVERRNSDNEKEDPRVKATGQAQSATQDSSSGLDGFEYDPVSNRMVIKSTDTPEIDSAPEMKTSNEAIDIPVKPLRPKHTIDPLTRSLMEDAPKIIESEDLPAMKKWLLAAERTQRGTWQCEKELEPWYFKIRDHYYELKRSETQSSQLVEEPNSDKVNASQASGQTNSITPGIAEALADVQAQKKDTKSNSDKSFEIKDVHEMNERYYEPVSSGMEDHESYTTSTKTETTEVPTVKDDGNQSIWSMFKELEELAYKDYEQRQKEKSEAPLEEKEISKPPTRKEPSPLVKFVHQRLNIPINRENSNTVLETSLDRTNSTASSKAETNIRPKLQLREDDIDLLRPSDVRASMKTSRDMKETESEKIERRGALERVSEKAHQEPPEDVELETVVIEPQKAADTEISNDSPVTNRPDINPNWKRFDTQAYALPNMQWFSGTREDEERMRAESRNLASREKSPHISTEADSLGKMSENLTKNVSKMVEQVDNEPLSREKVDEFLVKIKALHLRDQNIKEASTFTSKAPEPEPTNRALIEPQPKGVTSTTNPTEPTQTFVQSATTPTTTAPTQIEDKPTRPKSHPYNVYRITVDPESGAISTSNTRKFSRAHHPTTPTDLVKALQQFAKPEVFIKRLPDVPFEIIWAGKHQLVLRIPESWVPPVEPTPNLENQTDKEKQAREAEKAADEVQDVAREVQHRKKYLNPIDGTTAYPLHLPPIGNFASPTGFVNYDSFLPPPPPYREGVKRTEEVSSGVRGEGEAGRRRAWRIVRLVLGAGVVCYVAGVGAELMVVGG
ncbi:hypothetical protein M501DRAFT_1019307 [Patellaria atrata CBS 101060]|uniref:Uncharacterized protein n=1 Tax=Patellaria atrata CBS 101060 TaxID=1346257 RepID=A0A9P4VLZ6_9PEZI|nr:hypothetical protein M501DRAFT_1019307 [Patellaria atrata CBS 101060]